MNKFNFNETYLIEGFFDDLEDDLDNSDIVSNIITKSVLNYIDVRISASVFKITHTEYNESANNDITIEFEVNPKNINQINFNNIITDNTYGISFDMNESYLEYINICINNMRNIKSILGLFYGCTNLSKITFDTFDTSNITCMDLAFNKCKSLKHIDLSNFNTSNTDSMEFMFSNCKSLTELDLSNFNTSKVISMTGMFYNCESFKELDLSNFNTYNVIYISYMFKNCHKLEKLNLTNFDITNNSNNYEMFNGCDSLKYIKCSENFKNWCCIHLQSISLDVNKILWEII